MPSGVDSNTLNIRIDPWGSIPFFQKNVMVSSLVFENSTLLNLTNAIERSGSEKYFKPIFDIWEGYKVDFFQSYLVFKGGSVRIFRVKEVDHTFQPSRAKLRAKLGVEA